MFCFEVNMRHLLLAKLRQLELDSFYLSRHMRTCAYTCTPLPSYSEYQSTSNLFHRTLSAGPHVLWCEFDQGEGEKAKETGQGGLVAEFVGNIFCQGDLLGGGGDVCQPGNLHPAGSGQVEWYLDVVFSLDMPNMKLNWDSQYAKVLTIEYQRTLQLQTRSIWQYKFYFRPYIWGFQM